MTAAILSLYEVRMPICGMSARIPVRADSEAEALEVAKRYLIESGMDETRIATDCAVVSHLRVPTEHENSVQAFIVAQNIIAAESQPITTVDYDESTGRFVVKCGDEYIECFSTRREAESFALEHDQLVTGGTHTISRDDEGKPYARIRRIL